MNLHRLLIFSLSAVCLSGCIANQGLGTLASSENNTYNLWRISKGMNQEIVMRIMHKPYRYECFQFEEDVYDVWFYITRPSVLGQSRMVPQNLTPLTFRNGILVDVGYVYYNYLIKEEELRAKLPIQTEDGRAGEDREDKSIEKTLDVPPGSQPAQPSGAKKTTPSAPAPTTPQKQAPAPQKTAPAKKQGGQSPNQNAPQPPQDMTPPNQLPGKPSQKTPPQQNQMPGRPAAPPTGPGGTTGFLSMAKAPKKTETNSDTPAKELPAAEEESVPAWNSEDERMQEEESEQNFDYW